MAITNALCNSFKQEALQGIHLAADTYKIALFTNAATLNKSTTAYAATNEVSGAGYSAGGVALTGFSTSLSTDTAVLTFSDVSIAASTITARGALIYNSSRSNKAVAVYDFGSDITSTNGNFNITMPTANAASGLVRFA